MGGLGTVAVKARLARWFRAVRETDVVRRTVGFVIAGVAIWWLVRDFDGPAVVNALRRAEYRWVLVAVAAIVATAWTRTRRWQLLLRPYAVRFFPAFHALLMGQVANLVLPLRGGDVTRAMLIGPEGETGTATALGTVALEKIWDLVLLLLSGLVLLVVMPLPGWFTRSTWSTALLLLIGVPLLWAALRWQAVLLQWMGQLLALLPGGWDRAVLPRLRRLAEGLASIRRADTSLRAFFWTGLTWALGAVANWAVLAAFGLHSGSAALLLLVALMVGNSVVPAPVRLGVFEGITVVILALFEIPGDLALAAGLVLHVVVMGPPLVMTALLSLSLPWLEKELDGVS